MVYDTLKSCSPSPVLVRAVSQSGGICFSEKWRRARVIGKFANSLTIISANAIGACINNTGRRTRDESLPLQRLEPNASLSQVCQPQSHLSKSGYSDPSIHSESGHQPPRMSSLRLAFFFSFFFCLSSRRVTRLWTGGCAGVSIDPKWQVAPESVAWRQWLGRHDREGQLHLGQARGQARPGAQELWPRRGQRSQCIVKLFVYEGTGSCGASRLSCAPSICQ